MRNTTKGHYLISRFNTSFMCDEYLSTNGVDFTLHVDKAQGLSFEEAKRWSQEGTSIVYRDTHAKAQGLFLTSEGFLRTTPWPT